VGIHLPGYTLSTKITTAQIITGLPREVGNDCFLLAVYDHVIPLQRGILVTIAVDTKKN
jgi:hypothetical protein